jgi:hypothetical protein
VSKLGGALFEETHLELRREGRISEEDVRRIALWLDLNSVELGSYSLDPRDQARQRAGEVVWAKLDFDPQNPQRMDVMAGE